MGFRMFDFECENGHRHENLVDPEDRWLDCPECGKPARRLIGAPRPVLDGMSGDFSTAADQWEKRRESHMKKERRNMEQHGTYK